jgi:hypothetical protein
MRRKRAGPRDLAQQGSSGHEAQDRIIRQRTSVNAADAEVLLQQLCIVVNAETRGPLQYVKTIGAPHHSGPGLNAGPLPLIAAFLLAAQLAAARKSQRFTSYPAS